MTEFHIRDQQADSIQNAENIYNFGPAAESAAGHRARARVALAARDYAAVAGHAAAALAVRPDDATAHFYAALAALRGVHPDRHPTRRTDEVLRRLVAATRLEPRCGHTKVLALIVNEGLLLRTGRASGAVTEDTRHLIATLDPAIGREILSHTPVPESAVWQHLALHLR
ncbi:hypothetical protein [Streptomyces sp. BV129]|uniref:hypothetical protein n=1 Tax=Streptomyces sp. BV129 TaxID=2849671 RepID=UPI001C2F038A|nr:hypothetical protein [Streptomyces sp. BV129]MBV1950102.1 hypothetical protein [Streptomyces sp. BV129]